MPGAHAPAASRHPHPYRPLGYIPGRPMPLNELASPMKADYEKLTAVVKASGMTPQ